MTKHKKLVVVDPNRELTVTFIDAAGRTQVCSIEEAGAVPFETTKPVRRIPSYRHQKHMPGHYFSATTGSHIAYESHLERQWLTMFDFEADVTALAGQPMALEGGVSGSFINHVPDLFVRFWDGRGLVVDVKNPVHVDDDKVIQLGALTRECCRQAGLDYRLVGAVDPQRWANVKWLAGYQRTPALGMDQVSDILDRAQEPTPLRDLVATFDHPALGRVVVFHLMWKRQLRFDLDRPLRDATLLSAAPE